MESIYAIVKRNNESFYFECKPYDAVIKLKQELINNFFPMDDKDMRLYLEQYDQNGNKSWTVRPRLFTPAARGHRDGPPGGHHQLLLDLVREAKR